MNREDKILSVFVDESGSFDSSVIPSRFYIVTCLFHDQRKSIDELIAELESSFAALDLPGVCVHAGPLIRREDEYRKMDIVLRRKLFGRMIAFTRRAPVEYRSFVVDKMSAGDAASIEQSLLTQISLYIAADSKRLDEFDRINIYYDDGQSQVKSILKAAFASKICSFVPEVEPSKYRLFQSADLLCTIELLKAKLDVGLPLTQSEAYFFDKRRDLIKNVINPLRRLMREPPCRIADPLKNIF